MNRLASEKSPYLLQHAHNPVDWFPWGEEAFERARREDKPIFLSIGYSTCHWCHVMERESFEDGFTARILNERYITIKVDREERPEIDGIYMQYVTATTGRGGWPMSVFLTPEQKPFYGGTYFPPEDRYGMPGFKTLLTSIADAWTERREEIREAAESSVVFLKNVLELKNRADATVEGSLEKLSDLAVEYYQGVFDDQYAGFGRSLKFPRSHALSFLFRAWSRTGAAACATMSFQTLEAMYRGGIFDQVGGGFHRYSTDRQWRVPHFEKMLYDQALLVKTYLEGYQIARRESEAQAARQTMDYLLEEMSDPQGGFYSAQDADSPDPELGGQKKEGAYFVWSEDQVKACLDPHEFRLAQSYFGLRPEGNAIEDPHAEFTGKNILYQAKSEQKVASEQGVDIESVRKTIRRVRHQLLASRKKRPSPHRDDKILVDWNGLAISAFASASGILEEPRYLEAAVKTARFIAAKMMRPDGRLWRRYRDQEAGIEAGLGDYACLAEAFLDLYEATFDADWMELAERLGGKMKELFWDGESGGFFMTARDAETLIARPKEVYDGALPSGNSMALSVLARLAQMTEQPDWEALTEKSARFLKEAIAQEPSNYTQALAALERSESGAVKIVITAPAGDPFIAAAKKKIDSLFLPNRIVLFKTAEAFSRPSLTVCRDRICSQPVHRMDELEKILEPRRRYVASENG